MKENNFFKVTYVQNASTTSKNNLKVLLCHNTKNRGFFKKNFVICKQNTSLKIQLKMNRKREGFSCKADAIYPYSDMMPEDASTILLMSANKKTAV